MGIKVKAIERNVAFSKDPDDAHYAYVMQPSLYSQLELDKVVEQASLLCGLQAGVIQTSLSAFGKVVATWSTEGHSIPLPGLGTMRFGLRSSAVDDVSKVSASLITSRRVIFTPSVEIKQALANTSVNITCYDRTGKIVKTVTSDDKDDVEDDNKKPSSGSGTESGGSSTGKGDDNENVGL